MKFNFRKISAIASSALMVGMSVGVAAASNYPAPFVSGGSSDVAIVYGTGAGVSVLDNVAAANIMSDLQSNLGGSSTTSTTTVTGEAAALFTDGSKIYINNSLNSVVNVVTKSDNMATALKEETFSGNVDAKTTQTVVLGSNPQITFAKQPTSSDDPVFALSTSSNSGLYTYNATVDFNKAVNFTHADSKSQGITLFGQKFIIGSATDGSNLVLLKSAEKVSLSSDSPTAEVTIKGKKYTVELISASDTAATIAVTNEAGVTDSKEVNEAASKKVNDLTIAVINADETNLKLSATIVAGSEKVTIPVTAGSVTVGESDTVIDGTTASITGGTTAATKIVVSIRAPNSDSDAIKPGESSIDPVFGTIKLDFPELNIADDSETSRENIKFKNTGDDRLSIEMTDHRGNAKTIQYAYNNSAMALQWDTSGHNIIVSEMAAGNKSDYIVVGNEDEGRLLKVTTITNQTTGYSSDKVTFTDVFSGESTDATLTADGTGTVTLGGKSYSVGYFGDTSISDDAKTVRLNYPDSSTGDMIIYPTIQTSKGAKVMFYKPLTINLGNWDGADSDLTNVKIPNGADSYQSIGAAPTQVTGNITVNSVNLNAAGQSTTVAITNTGLSFNFTYSAANTTQVFLVANDGGNVVNPAVVIIEEKDNSNTYRTLIVTSEEGNSADDGIGVNDVVRSWGGDVTWDSLSLYTDSKKTKEADLWGTIALVDSSDSDQKSATISYPNEQIYAKLYIAANDAEITSSGSGSTPGTKIGDILVKDSEVSSVSSKNLIIVGGSCINSAAATVLGGAGCGADFTAKTGIGSGEYLIQSVADAYTTGKIALVVAGYEIQDTQNAQKYLTTQTVDTSAGKKYKGTSSTVATAVTTTA
ncbi:MAG: hypothetical protein AABW81_01920 [Nanoarchaeota archaeon]